MTNTFLSNLTTNGVVGENGMPANSTTDSAVLDLFFLLGTRPTKQAVENAVLQSWSEDPTLTLKALFQSRDVRQGKGERDSFKWGIQTLAEKSEVGPLVSQIAEYGRWDDLHCLFGTVLERHALLAISMGLEAKNGLSAKWTPRKGPISEKIRKYLGLTPKSFRKLLVGLTKVVETQMCAKQWAEIAYSKVPSRAGVIYSKAFARHDSDRYKAWKEALKKPESESGEKINVSTLYPHDVVMQALGDSSYPFDAAWDKMQENFPPIKEKIMTVCDVSGSMGNLRMVYGSGVLPIHVSVSLGLFLSQRNTGPFKDTFLTFSERPRLQTLTGTLLQRIKQLNTSKWDMNTDLEAVFNKVADSAKNANPEDVPSIILILSDMQFDQCVTAPNANAMQMIDAKFQALGVERPKIVFWNLTQSGAKTIPIKTHQTGAALISGFSPTIVKGLLGNPTNFTPYGIMLNTLMNKRYESIKVD